MVLSRFSELDGCYKKGLPAKISSMPIVQVDPFVVKCTGEMGDAISFCGSKQRGIFKFTGKTAVGKTTLFPARLAAKVDRQVVVICRNPLAASQAYDGACARTGKELSLWESFFIRDVHGCCKTAYVGAPRAMSLIADGKFEKGVIFILDESLTDTSEYRVLRNYLEKLANEHLVLYVSTHNGVEDGIASGITVRPVSEYKNADIVGKKVIRFFSSATAIVDRLQEGKEAMVLYPWSTLAEFREVKRACGDKSKGLMIYATNDVAFGLNLPVDYVVCSNGRLGICEVEGTLEVGYEEKDPVTEFQEIARVGRFGSKGVAFNNDGSVPKINPGRKDSVPADVQAALEKIIVKKEDHKTGFGLIDMVSGKVLRDAASMGMPWVEILAMCQDRKAFLDVGLNVGGRSEVHVPDKKDVNKATSPNRVRFENKKGERIKPGPPVYTPTSEYKLSEGGDFVGLTLKAMVETSKQARPPEKSVVVETVAEELVHNSLARIDGELVITTGKISDMAFSDPSLLDVAYWTSTEALAKSILKEAVGRRNYYLGRLVAIGLSGGLNASEERSKAVDCLRKVSRAVSVFNMVNCLLKEWAVEVSYKKEDSVYVGKDPFRVLEPSVGSFRSKFAALGVPSSAARMVKN